jgi:hypothetical protein
MQERYSWWWWRWLRRTAVEILKEFKGTGQRCFSNRESKVVCSFILKRYKNMCEKTQKPSTRYNNK